MNTSADARAEAELRGQGVALEDSTSAGGAQASLEVEVQRLIDSDASLFHRPQVRLKHQIKLPGFGKGSAAFRANFAGNVLDLKTFFTGFAVYEGVFEARHVARSHPYHRVHQYGGIQAVYIVAAVHV